MCIYIYIYIYIHIYIYIYSRASQPVAHRGVEQGVGTDDERPADSDDQNVEFYVDCL